MSVTHLCENCAIPKAQGMDLTGLKPSLKVFIYVEEGGVTPI